MRKKNGYFITFEGIDGSGKSTQILALANSLKSLGYQLLVTGEPPQLSLKNAPHAMVESLAQLQKFYSVEEIKGKWLGQWVRQLLLYEKNLTFEPLTQLYLLLAARYQHITQYILPQLQMDRLVICDRFIDSTYAYQAYGMGLDIEIVKNLCQPLEQLLCPDLTILLDLDYSVAQKRLNYRQMDITKNSASTDHELDQIEMQSRDFFIKVRRGFLARAKTEPIRMSIISAEQSKEVIANQILTLVLQRLEQKLP